MLLKVVCRRIERSVFLRQLFKHDGNRCAEGRGFASELPAGRHGIVVLCCCSILIPGDTDPGVPAEQSAGVPSTDGLAAMAIMPANVVEDVTAATPPDVRPVCE